VCFFRIRLGCICGRTLHGYLKNYDLILHLQSSIEKGAPEGTSLHISNLTRFSIFLSLSSTSYSGLYRNVNAGHLREIFGHFGVIKNVRDC
jgi:hypothetical protein